LVVSALFIFDLSWKLDPSMVASDALLSTLAMKAARVWFGVLQGGVNAKQTKRITRVTLFGSFYFSRVRARNV